MAAQTTIRVSVRNRDRLHALAKEMRNATLDEILEDLLFERESNQQMAALMADPEAYAEYLAENRKLAEVDVDLIRD